MDLMVQGRHFRRDWSTAYDVGRKCAASNLADVVAMGAHPTALLVGLAAPPDLDLDWIDGLTDGLRDECALVGASVAGGDLVRADLITIAVTALGDLRGRTPVVRSGARPGERVVVVGVPGRAAAGLALLHSGRLEHPLADAHRRPAPAYARALALADHATAMIDLSDGLVADLTHVAVASNVRIELVAASLPTDPAVGDAATLLGVDPFDWQAGGGDDHCFAATVPPGVEVDATVIGTVLEIGGGANPLVSFADRAGPTSPGHDHFRK
jgi:thiamine-monophosphate kinase